MRILMVCLGNICRSPRAEAALRAELAGTDWAEQVHIDSAGTAAYHVGEPPDRRMTAIAAEDGLVLEGAARQVRAEDLDTFDLVLAMDRANLADLVALAGADRERRERIRLFRDFEDGADGPDVPDPYYGGEAGFRKVVAICRAGAAGVAAEVREQL